MSKKSSLKIRAKVKNGVTTVKALVRHPMETGLRKDKKTGKMIPAKFIQNISCELNGKKVINGEIGVAVSKNPYFSFKFEDGKSGDEITMSWTDNLGKSDTLSAKIK